MRPGWPLPICLAVLVQAGAALACTPADFVVALDVGHTPERPGAVSARGVPEFRFNQGLAQVIVESLVAAGFGRSFVVNADGRIGPLKQRVATAAARHADLFLSIHHDSLQPQYLSTWTSGGVSRRYSDRFHGFSLFVSEKNPRFDASRRFAELIGRALKARGLTPTLHHAEPIKGENRPLLDADLGLYRYDGLVVLRAATMPAVLLEAGVILNRDEELRLTDPARRQLMAAGIVAAVRGFCDGVGRD